MKTISLLAFAGLFFTAVPQVRADFIAGATLTAAAAGATNSNGSGTITLDYHTATNDFTYTASWTNLTGPAIAAHIHYGPPGVEGPIILPFFNTPMPASDTISGTLTQADVTPNMGINTIADVAAAIQAGNTYFNVHTMQYPGGEIRGQLGIIPEPTTIGLLGLGLLGAAVLSRRLRK